MSLSLSKRHWSLAALAATLVAGLTLHGCSQTQSNTQSNLSPCEPLDKLIPEHQNGFKELRHSPRPFNAITVYKTRYQVIDNHCEIWGWGHGKVNYVCSKTSPNEEVARARYNDAVKSIRQCLSNDWQELERPRKVGNGSRTLFSKAGSETGVIVHVFENPGVFKSEWSVYASVGNFTGQL